MMVLLNKKYNTVEIFEDIKELIEMIERFNDDIEKLDEFEILTMDTLLVKYDTNFITVVNYYDEVSKKAYGEISFSTWKVIEEKNTEIKKYKDMFNKKDSEKFKYLRNDLDNTVDQFLTLQDYDNSKDYYITFGVQGRNLNIELNADLYDSLRIFYNDMIEMFPLNYE